MNRHTSNATTRTRTASIRGSQTPLVARGDELASAESGLRYRIDRQIGQGGFGQVYFARRPGRSRTVPGALCVKVSRRIDGWIREAYFGQLLDGQPRAIALYDTFTISHADGASLYCLALEYARRATSARTSSAWAASGTSARPGGRSPASCRCSASSIAGSCSIATSRR